MKFSVIFYHSKKLKSDLKILKKNPEDFEKIKKVFIDFSENPLSDRWNTRKMEPKSSDTFRLKWGNLRCIYDIDFGNKNIIVYRVGYRKDIYQ